MPNPRTSPKKSPRRVNVRAVGRSASKGFGFESLKCGCQLHVDSLHLRIRFPVPVPLAVVGPPEKEIKKNKMEPPTNPNANTIEKLHMSK